MNITTNTLLMSGANRCIGRRPVNETLRRGVKKNFYVALVICAIRLGPGYVFATIKYRIFSPSVDAWVNRCTS
jgi:hypothetical protein